MVCVRVCVVLRTPVQMYLARWVQFFYTIAKLQMHQHKKQFGTSGIPVLTVFKIDKYLVLSNIINYKIYTCKLDLPVRTEPTLTFRWHPSAQLHNP